MKKSLPFLLVCYFLCLFGTEVLAQKSSSKYDAEVDKLLKQMTLEEKVGQMTQLTFGVFVDNTQPAFNIKKKDELRNAIVKYGVGSILNNAQDHAQTPEEWQLIINTIQDFATKESRLKIPVLYGVDAIHGATYITNSLLFPQQLGIGCSRNIELAKSMGRLTAMSTRASGIRWNFAPVLDVARSPLWSRFPESFGESTLLAEEFGVANIVAAQGKDVANPTSVAACMKHFLGYSGSNTGKDRTTSSIPDHVLREVFVPPFKKAIDAGAKTVMINSADINGVPVHASKKILTDLLRTELGFEGVAVTDWEDIIKLHTRHRVAATQKEAVYMAIEAGVDMSMVPYELSFHNYLVELVKEGRISESRIDLSVRRILKLKYELGLFTNAYAEKAALPNLYPKETEQACLAASRESIVLLKNTESILPFKKGTKLFVTGPTADYLPSLHGSWSYTWQGNNLSFYPKAAKTILTALKEMNGDASVTYKQGINIKGETVNPEAEILAGAKAADVVVICLGEDSYAEVPGNIDDLNLHPAQKKLVQQLALAGKPIVFVLAEGRPRLMAEIEPLAKGIVLALQPGTFGGQAVAEVLLGITNPSGKLAFTYPKAAHDLLTYDAQYSDVLPEANAFGPNGEGLQYRPQYPFGYGLSYTTFEYSNLMVSKKQLVGTSDSVVVQVTVQNTGKVAGKEAIELFVRDVFASINPAFKKHKAFAKISLAPGEKKTVSFTLKVSQLAMVNQASQTVTEEGEFLVMIGALQQSINYKK